MKSITLTIDLKSFWHVGTGKGSGSHLDALVDKDQHGLPIVPGRMLKGLLRDAVYRLNEWGHFEEQSNLIENMFGSAGFLPDGVPRNETKAGCLRFSNAILEENIQLWLLQNEQRKDSITNMYQDLYSTAIDALSGVAKKHSLRGIQATIPMELQAEITQIKETKLEWERIIEKSLPLIRAVGGYRNRGMGRAVLSLSNNSNREATI